MYNFLVWCGDGIVFTVLLRTTARDHDSSDAVLPERMSMTSLAIDDVVSRARIK